MMHIDEINFLIIGATKSATTWLQKSLQTDAQVYMPDPELHYFSREYERGDGWYSSQFSPLETAKLIGEKSNSYLEVPEAAARIASKLPRVKLIAQLRNPVDRAYSDYCMMYRRGEVGRSVEKYLDPDRPSNTRLVSAGLYCRQLLPYYDFFPAENILVTFYETLKTSPQAQVRAVRQFLGLPAQSLTAIVPGRVKDKTTPMLSPELRRLLRPVRRLTAPFRENVHFQAIRAKFQREIDYPPFPSSIRRRLTDYYASDVEVLSALLGRDLSTWLHHSAMDSSELGTSSRDEAAA